MPRRSRTRGERATDWIEAWCAAPGGKSVQLTVEERAVIYTIYDGGLPIVQAGTGRLAAFLTLLHLVGPEARAGAAPPQLEVDLFTLWIGWFSAPRLSPASWRGRRMCGIGHPMEPGGMMKPAA